MRPVKIPILIYHSLFDQEKNQEKYAIQKDAFDAQMQYIHERGFKALLLNDLCNPSQNNNQKKNIVITFDDGNASDYEIAMPLLKKYDLKAVFFVIVSRVGQKGYVTWDQLAKMQSEGMSIQSHSLTHPYLSEISKDTLYSELQGSKAGIEKNISEQKVLFLAIPGGFFSDEVLTMAKDVGYLGVCTSVPGMVSIAEKESAFHLWSRFTITKVTPFADFKAILRGDPQYVALCETTYFFKNIAKRLMGGKMYHAIWSKFFKNR